MSRDSTSKILTVAFLLCVVCSILVSAAAVLLSDRQERNKAEEKRKNILQAAGIYDSNLPLDEQFENIESRIVDLATGEFVTDMDPAGFDSRAALRDPDSRHEIPEGQDLAGIKARSRYKDVYLVMDDNDLRQIILPVRGKGLWSTMYGFIALDADMNTVKGFAFYEHGETPGLGGEIDNPNWKKLWPGKQIYDAKGKVRIAVIKGQVDRDAPNAKFEVDGLSGATLTARGVSNLLHYWMGEDGYQPLLARLARKGGKE
jgi:Na+-transporting NADH:ubiquinone oxidoreductase subunit C